MKDSTDRYSLIGEDKVRPPIDQSTHAVEKKNKDWIKAFEEDFTIENLHRDENDKLKQNLQFDMIGAEPYLANALRRILIAEVPTMAISCVNMDRNTSVMQDEVLAHRFGLIPFKAPAKLFKEHGGKEEYTDENSVTYDIKIRGRKREDGAAGKSSLAEQTNVFSSEIKCRYTDGLLAKLGVDISDLDAVKKMKESDPCGPLYDNILIIKLAEGHEISARMCATKSTGTDHARHSPVSTAFYRFMPIIRLVDPSKVIRRHSVEVDESQKYVKKLTLHTDDAVQFEKSFNKGVIEVKESKKEGFSIVTVANPRLDMFSRNVFKHDNLKDSVEIAIKNDHQIFTVQSESAYTPEELVREAMAIFRGKCERVLESAEALAID